MFSSRHLYCCGLIYDTVPANVKVVGSRILISLASPKSPILTTFSRERNILLYFMIN